MFRTLSSETISVFFFKQKTAYEMLRSLVGSEMCIRDRCEFSSSQTDDLRRHLKVHSGEKSNKCNQCDYASSRAGHLRRHLKVHSGENATNVSLSLLRPKCCQWQKETDIFFKCS